jgi:hypothetical protein
MMTSLGDEETLGTSIAEPALALQSLLSWYHLQDRSPVTARLKTLREFFRLHPYFQGRWLQI